ncbi:N-acetylglucosamine kinase [Paenibacillus sp. MBLB4367]|uniref:N-acetylglucosamine kinase n=1 Tax=Paenibacillus sp. MBLB4367 TaxID=3384767 RepID=UPI003907FFE2
MAYYLGLDAGGSKTVAVITDEQGRIRGSGRSGCGNHQIDLEIARRSLHDAVEQALRQADVTASQIDFAYYGLAGADREADFRILRPMVTELGIANHDLACDTIIALRAGTYRPYGIVAICGSGINSAGINRSGQTYQCGGFGHDYGDWGGGSFLATEAFRAVIRSWEGREEPTLLTDLLLNAFGFDGAEKMFHDFLDHPRRVPLQAVKLLFEAAEAGDGAAITILRHQGVEIGKSAAAVIKKLSMQEEVFDLVLAGSVLTRGDAKFVHPYIEAYAHAVAPGCSLRVLTMEPVVGAVLLAMDKAGAAIESDVYERLSAINNLEGSGQSE